MTRPKRPVRAVPAISIGLSDLDVVALTIDGEARAEGSHGMQAIGCVIRNRADWGRWGASMRDVCLARLQFSCWVPAGGLANYNRMAENAEEIRQGRRPQRLQRAYDIAVGIMGALPDVTNGADHYYAPKAMIPVGRVPSWAVGHTPVATIGNHVFYRFRPPTTAGIMTT